MEGNKLVSIITPMYNAEKYVEATISSVIAQIYEDWEMIIVDDCSQDGSIQIAEQYARTEPRIRIVSHSRNMGISAARNTGISYAKGQYIAFLDSDDIWKKNKLSQQVSFMRNNGYAFTYTACILIDEDGGLIDKTLKPRTSVDYEGLLKSNCIVCSGVIMDASAVDIYVPDVKHEDYATWLDILKNGHTAYLLDEPLVEYRVRKSSVSANKLKSLSWVFNIYRNHLKMPFFQAVCRIVIYFFRAAAKYSNALEVVFKK